ncbi:Hypothetical predicted protein [Mytilus galloprovincialis]|uniref:Methyltransferase domain-containing protein n=1 Tax=Mytilus galloprovincialis TaxID=29158 RepID=A0A8B6HAC8_MYTGA|nr:Hypothetical predicted protein [Mytilus galloprovincialis]
MTSQKDFEMQPRYTSRCTSSNFRRFIIVAILGAFIILITVHGTDKCRDLFSSTTNIENAPENTIQARNQGFIARHTPTKEQNDKVLPTTAKQQLIEVSKLNDSKEPIDWKLPIATTQHVSKLPESKEQNGNGLKVNTNDSKKPNETTNWIEAFRELARDLREDDYFCPNKVERGQLKFDCNTSPFVVQKPCLVYSFGINNQWSFDDAMANIGCDVFSFDPSMGYTGEHVRPSGVHFYPIGLGSKSMDDFTPRMDNYVKKNPGKKWKIRTLGDLVKELNHSKRPIDMLKIDVESYEWEIIPNILQSGLVPRIKQMNMEFQIFEDTPPERIPHFLNVYKAMTKAGFKQFYCMPSVTLNKNDLKNKRLISECSYVNVNYAFRK